MALDLENLELRGSLICTPPVVGRPESKYVFQKTRAGHGNILADKNERQQVRAWVIGSNPRSNGQRQRRAVFANGVLAWHALSVSERAAWRAEASPTGLNAYQYFLKRYCQTHAAGVLTVWRTDFDIPGTAFDFGNTKFRTVWDGGLTQFID